MKVFYSGTSLKYLEKVKKNLAGKIVEGINKLPNEGDTKKLKGQKVKNLFRLRIGKIRIIYKIDENELKVIKIDTRGDVYK